MKVKLKAGEVEGIVYEIFGYANPQSKEVKIQGLVREELPKETTKFHLKRFGKKLQEELTLVQESTKEAWEEFGEKDKNEDGQDILKVPEDKMEDFKTKLTGILNSEIEVECHDFKIEDFEFKSKTPEYSYYLLEVLFTD